MSNFLGFISKPFSGVHGSQKHRLPSTPTCHTALPEQDRCARWSAQMTTGHQRDSMVYYQQYSDRTNIITPKSAPPTSPISNNLNIVTKGLSCSGDNQLLFLIGTGTSSSGPFRDSSYMHTERQLPLIATISSGISRIISSSLPAGYSLI